MFYTAPVCIGSFKCKAVPVISGGFVHLVWLPTTKAKLLTRIAKQSEVKIMQCEQQGSRLRDGTLVLRYDLVKRNEHFFFSH